MNKLQATIDSIQEHEGISLVTFNTATCKLTMVALDLPKTLHISSQVTLGVKATHIALAKHKHEDISLSNQIEASVRSVTHGAILCSVILHVNGEYLESIITQKSAQKMHIQVGESVIALIKSSDLYIFSQEES